MLTERPADEGQQVNPEVRRVERALDGVKLLNQVERRNPRVLHIRPVNQPGLWMRGYAVIFGRDDRRQTQRDRALVKAAVLIGIAASGS